MKTQQNIKKSQKEEFISKKDLEKLKLSLIKVHLQREAEHLHLMKILDQLLKD